MTRRVLLYPGVDGFIVAEVPSVPGCISRGKTRDEALANVREAISLHEEVLREHGEPLPRSRRMDESPRSISEREGNVEAAATHALR